MLPLVVVQFSINGDPAVADGGVVFAETTTVCCEAHPVPRSVTVNVYVFAALTK